MTTREKLIQAVLDLPESELELVAEILASHGKNGSRTESTETQAQPGDIIDDWGNLSAMKRIATGDMLKRMDEAEEAAGLVPTPYAALAATAS